MASNATVAAWWSGEDAVRLSCVPRHLPSMHGGKLPSRRSVYFWTTNGVFGVVLRRFKSGGQWCTTKQEIARWQVAVTEAAK